MSDFNAYRDGKVHVLSEKCSTCVYRPGNLMNLSEGRLKALAGEADANASAVICHQTLRTVGYEDQAVCRGYYDSCNGRNPTLALADALGVIAYDDPPTKD